ncbi:uncharacterized protein LOC118448400 [Vespa mandarinia]|uniref:uncharacterized protein LOC118448400 n=1 Tax=Vespa mandarinia TaxID=7446 RepID=UPI00160AAC41|nr:uncharacterized protein LOC118448400 [Vespa mandarinia]
MIRKARFSWKIPGVNASHPRECQEADEGTKSSRSNGGSCVGDHPPTSGDTAFGDGQALWRKYFEHMEKQSTKEKLNTQNEKDNKQQNTPEPSVNNIATQGDKSVGSQPAKGTQQNREREKLGQAKLLLAKMKLAITRQPNINKEIKQGIPELEDIIDNLEFIAGKRVASSPPQLSEETLKRLRQEATTTESTVWTEVVKKKGNKEKPGTKATKLLHQEKKKPRRSKDRPRKRTRPDAILLKPAQGKSYADVVGIIHQRFKNSASGVDIRSVRQTRTGGVLLELMKTTVDIRASFAETLRKEIGGTSSITELVPRTTLELRDCDCCTSSIEVEEALKRTLRGYAGKIEIKITNPNARQQRLALVKIEEKAAAQLLKAGRVLIGFISCRVRAEVRRCSRCLDYGHYSASCKGPDRSKVCNYCGSTGHKIKECKVSEPTCFLCSKSGVETRKHLAGSRACKALQEALATAKK